VFRKHLQYGTMLAAAALAAAAWFACGQHLKGSQAATPAGPVQAAAPGAAIGTLNDPPTAVVDSARPVEEELRRFRAALGVAAPRELAGAPRSRAALVRSFVRALERKDTATLASLVIDAAEFAWFYYPFTVYTHPPYTQPPGMVWLVTEQNSRKGLGRLVRSLGGRPLDLRGYRCGRSEPQDVNLLHLECGVLLGRDPAPVRLFGTILERQGRFKFVSYANRY
jgi:hypothetical protein